MLIVYLLMFFFSLNHKKTNGHVLLHGEVGRRCDMGRLRGM